MKPLMLKIILFALTKVLQHSATKHVAVRDRMMQHNCAVQIRLKDNSIGRYYIFQNGRVHSELVSFYQSGFQIHSMLCQMALHHLLCSRLVTHPDKNSQALSRQCLDRRIADTEILKREVETWKAGRNDAKTRVRWRFTTANARIKLHRLYPAIKP